MKSPFYFIVKPLDGKRYNNTKTIEGVNIITSSSEEDYKFSNRKGIVHQVPLHYNGPIKIGDILLVHHNVFKYYNDMRGRQQSGKSYFKDDLFFIDNDQFFLYKQNNKWYTHDKYCFIKPIKTEESFLSKNGEEPLIGVVKYNNRLLEQKGVKEGDRISFTPNSEYPFMLDGEKLYRMFVNNITMVL